MRESAPRGRTSSRGGVTYTAKRVARDPDMAPIKHRTIFYRHPKLKVLLNSAPEKGPIPEVLAYETRKHFVGEAACKTPAFHLGGFLPDSCGPIAVERPTTDFVSVRDS